MMGFTFGFGAPLGYAAGAGRLDAAWAALYGAAILWDLGFDTIYAHQDREDDALVGVKSTARLFGERTRAVPCRLLRRRDVAAGAGGLAGRARAAGSIRRWRCQRCCWHGRSARSTSTTQPAACGCSRPTARSGWRSRRRSCSVGPEVPRRCPAGQLRRKPLVLIRRLIARPPGSGRRRYRPPKARAAIRGPVRPRCRSDRSDECCE